MATRTIFNKPKQKKPFQSADSSEVKSEQPIIPMSKVSLDVIKKLQTQPYPQLTLATHSTISDALQLYYNEYARLFRQNQILNDELACILQQRNSLADQFNQIKKMKSYDDNIRRRRRYASQIERNYHCPMPKCNKGYGSEGSLTHHVRLKHPKFFQSGDYEIYLQTYILPKQQIKNEDNKDGKLSINVEEFHGEGRKINRQQSNKIEISDDGVKQAKEEDSVGRNGGYGGDKKSGVESEKTKENKRQAMTNKEPSTPQLQSLMREVDGYIVLEDGVNNKQGEEQKQHEDQTEIKNLTKVVDDNEGKETENQLSLANSNANQKEKQVKNNKKL